LESKICFTTTLPARQAAEHLAYSSTLNRRPLSMTSPLPRVIAALQLPPFRAERRWSMAWYEDFLLTNARVFVEGGIRAIKVQDETREAGRATIHTVARMAALGTAFKREFPSVDLGLIVQAHDAVGPIAIADATGASFVRLKVFVGAVVNAEGERHALGIEALDYRASLGRSDIRILADVHDRTSVPVTKVPHEKAALWAQSLGADALVLTGDSFSDTLHRIETARGAGVRRPILIGGGVDESNVREALGSADSVIVSTSLRRPNVEVNDLVQWDQRAVDRLMARAA
jgi:predicted TIM-barrel enzyme